MIFALATHLPVPPGGVVVVRRPQLVPQVHGHDPGVVPVPGDHHHHHHHIHGVEETRPPVHHPLQRRQPHLLGVVPRPPEPLPVLLAAAPPVFRGGGKILVL